MLIVIIGLLLMIIGLLVCAAYAFSAQAAAPVNERMEKYTAVRLRTGYDRDELSRLIFQSPLVVRIITAGSEVLAIIPKVQALDRKMAQAGIALRGSEFIVLTVGVALFGSVASILLTRGSWLIALLAGGLIYGGMFLWLQAKINRRRQTFNDQLGDACLMIANALRSGMSFLQAIGMVSAEMQQPIAGEFARVVRETQLGVSTEEALKHLRQRIESYDLELFVTAVLIQREVGGNLAALMDHIAENVRDRLLAGREMKTLTAQGRLSGVVVGAIPLVLVVALSMLSPGYYDILFTNQIGYWCVGVAAVSYL
ncbi:MAG TPA: type II secretion system F family protein, partial [Negativicutes bacterium]